VYYAQKNIFLTVNTQKISIFLTSYFCVYFSERSPSEKYFSDGIRIFLCVFARTEECEFPVVRPCNGLERSLLRPVRPGSQSIMIMIASIFFPRTYGKIVYLFHEALFGCYQIHLNPYVLRWFGVEFSSCLIPIQPNIYGSIRIRLHPNKA